MADLRVKALCNCGMGWNTPLDTFSGSTVEQSITDHTKELPGHIVTVEFYEPESDGQW